MDSPVGWILIIQISDKHYKSSYLMMTAISPAFYKVYRREQASFREQDNKTYKFAWLHPTQVQVYGKIDPTKLHLMKIHHHKPSNILLTAHILL